MNRLSSHDAWNAYAYDSDMLVQVPIRPRIIPELIAFPFDSESLLIVGAGSRKVLSGPFCKVLLRDLWPRLDGSVDIDQIEAEFTASGNIKEILALLQRARLIESGGEEPVANFPTEVEAFIGRHVAGGGVLESREQAAMRLRDSVVVVLAAEADTEMLTKRLLSSGFGMALAPQDDRLSKVTPTHYLVVGDAVDLHEQVEQVPKESGATVLLSYVSESGAAIGPLVLPTRSPCLDCSIKTMLSNLQQGDPSGRDFFLELTAQHLLSAITHTNQNQLFSVSITHAEIDGQWAQKEISVCRTPGCSACGLASFSGLVDGSDQAAAWKVLNSTMLPPWELLSRRTHEAHYSAKNTALIKQADEILGGEELSLPLSVEAYIASLNESTIPLLDSLSKTGLALQLAYGYVDYEIDGILRRKKVAPTGGGLRSPEAYIYYRGVVGIEDGIYRYAPATNKLQCVETEVELTSFEASVGTRLPTKCAVIVGIARTKKLWPKYKMLSVRLSLLDAGVAQAYVHDSCWALGVAIHECSDWRSEMLLQILQLPTCRRYYDVSSVTVLGFDQKPRTPLGLEALEDDVFVGLGRSLRSSVQFGGDSLQTWCTASTVNFAAYVDNAVGRASMRDFELQPIELSCCVQLARSFYAREKVLGNCGAANGRPKLFLVNNFASPDFPAGFYSASENGDLALRHQFSSSVDIVKCFNQRSIGSAPLVLIAAVDIDVLFRDQGAAGPAVGITRTANLLAAAWLAARTLGLEGCLAGGSIESELRVRMGLDGYSCFPILTLALGRKIG